jgi:uncharacterized protein
LALVGFAAAPAYAHVTVNPREATQGGFTALAFRVPNERDDASTTKLSVAFPADAPLAFVSVRPHPGWTYQVTKTKLAQPIKSDDGEVTEAVSTITWTAASPATAIKAGEYDEFSVSVGPLPEGTDQLAFKANQTYSNGEVVRWIEQAPAGSTTEPEHPAPTLALLPAAEGAAASPPAATEPAAPAAAGNEDNDGLIYTALALGALGALLGVGGLLAGLGARRRSATAAPTAGDRSPSRTR